MQLLCSGTFYEDWISETGTGKSFRVIVTLCFLLTFILGILVLITNYKWRLKVERKNPLQKTLNINIGNFFTSWSSSLIITAAIILTDYLSKIDPRQLNVFPNTYLVVLVQGVLPAFLYIALPIQFLSSKKIAIFKKALGK